MGNKIQTGDDGGRPGSVLDFIVKLVKATNTSRPTAIGKGVASAVLPVLSTLAFLFSVSAQAQLFIPVQTYYVPIPASQVSQALEAVDPDDTSDCIISFVSIAAAADGTVIVYDRTADGYEANLSDLGSFSSTTEVWGDANPSNGDVCAVVSGSCSNDTITAGDVMVLQNNVSVGDDQCNPSLALFDVNGGDRFASTQPVAVTRLAWATPDQATLLAGAIEVYPTRRWGTEFQLPAGEDTNTDGASANFVGGASSPELFECTIVTVMAAEDDTEVTIDGGAPQMLNQGESLLYGVTGTDQAAECESTSVLAGMEILSDKPVQVDMLIGDIGADYEMRWYTLFPREQWSSVYFNPVGTPQRSQGNIANPNQPTNLYMFNPGSVAIDVTAEFQLAPTQTISVLPGSVSGVAVPEGEGTRLSSQDGIFYAIAVANAGPSNAGPQIPGEPSTIGRNNRDWDWGFTLIPDSFLTTQVLLGFAPGSDPTKGNKQNGSPVWVTPTADTTIFVDFDNSGNSDLSIAASALQSVKITDSDFDMTGAVIFTTDGTTIAAAWGENPLTANPASPGLDLGTTVPPLPAFLAAKGVELVADLNGDGLLNPGEMLRYTIRITNVSRTAIDDVFVSDIVPFDTTYVAMSTEVDGVPIPDDGIGDGFPLDVTGGVNLNDFVGPLLARSEFEVTFLVTVNAGMIDLDSAPECPTTEIVVNMATVEALGIQLPLEATQCVYRPEIDIEKLTNGFQADDGTADAGLNMATDVPEIAPGATITWTYLVTNTSTTTPIPFDNVTVTDSIPGVIPMFDPASDVGGDGILSPGEVWTYTAQRTAPDLGDPAQTTELTIIEGCRRLDSTDTPFTSDTYENIGRVTIPGDSDEDPSHWCNPPPEIDIEKLTNDFDADDGTADAGTDMATDVPEIAPGETVTWTYLVTNPGSVSIAFADVTVTDSITGVTPVLDPASDTGSDGILSPGEVWTYTAQRTAPDLGDPAQTTELTIIEGCRRLDSTNTPFTSETYENIGRVTIPGDSDEDPSHWCNPEPEIDIEKLTNGFDADDGTANAGTNMATDVPEIAPGQTVTWTYLVTNPGAVSIPLADVTVTDSISGVAPVFDATSDDGGDGILSPGEVWIYTAQRTAPDLGDPTQTTDLTIIEGCRRVDSTGTPFFTETYENIGRVTIPGDSDEDPSHWCNPEPEIDIEKLTNGFQADDGTASAGANKATDVPEIAPGQPVTWTYLVTNPGTVAIPLADVTVTDSVPGVIPVFNPASDVGGDEILSPAEVWTYTAERIAPDLGDPAQTTDLTIIQGCERVDSTGTPFFSDTYENIGRVTIPGDSDEDPSHWCNPPPSIQIVKFTNGFDANDPNGPDVPVIAPGAEVTWTYNVTNNGPVAIDQADIKVTDSVIGDVAVIIFMGDGDTMLAPMETWIYEAKGTAVNLVNPPADPNLELERNSCEAVEGSVPGSTAYTNIGTVTIPSAQDSDPSSYCPPAPRIQIIKRTNGFDANIPVGSDVPAIVAGDTVTWTYEVKNIGMVDINEEDIVVTDNVILPSVVKNIIDKDDDDTVLAPGEVWIYEATGKAINLVNPPADPRLRIVDNVCQDVVGSAPGTNAYTNIGTVTIPTMFDDDPSSYCGPPPNCDISVEKTCEIPQAPSTLPGKCSGKIQEFTVVWMGTEAITVSGIPNNAPNGVVNPGQEVTFDPDASDNDVFITLSGGVSGQSKFHLSCSDDDMNGDNDNGDQSQLPGQSQDCGKFAGNGKSGSGFVNTWVFEGLVDAEGLVLDCTAPTGGFPSETEQCVYTPTPAFGSCKDAKPVTSLTMTWNGPSGMNLVTEAGETINDVQNGQVISFGTAGLGNDVDVTLSGSVSGNSTFHVSCSDDNMNGPEDCGSAQGNGKNNGSGLINQFLFGGLAGEGGGFSCPGVPGGGDSAEVLYGIRVSNPNSEALMVNILDDVLGVKEQRTIEANSVLELPFGPVSVTPDSSNVFTNTVNVSAVGVTTGATCAAMDTVDVRRLPPPQPPQSCKDIKGDGISEVSVVWNGTVPVNVVMESGEQFMGIQPGNKITFQEADTGNDVFMNIFNADTGGSLGESRFHVSCSDDDMDGSEDCGKAQGNGKDGGNFVNTWLFDGMAGTDGAFSCPPDDEVVVDPEPGTGGGDGVVSPVNTQLDLGDDKVKWKLKNTGSSDVLLTSIQLVFPSQHDELKKVKLNGDVAKDVNEGSPVFLDVNDFEPDVKKRRIDAGKEETLELEFTDKYKNHGQADFVIIMTFDNGQTLTFDRGVVSSVL